MTQTKYASTNRTGQVHTLMKTTALCTQTLNFMALEKTKVLLDCTDWFECLVVSDAFCIHFD